MGYCSIFAVPHWRYHTAVLFDSSLPVFVAVTISAAVTTTIHALVSTTHPDDELTTIILLNFFYSLLSYFAAVYVMISQSMWKALSVRNIDYIHSVSIENASFAWFSTVSLIILKRVYNGETGHFGYALGAWLLTIIVILAIIYGANRTRYSLGYVNLTEKEIERLEELDSESFSLSIAFGLTIIIAAAIISNQSTNYLSGVDDITSVNDDGRNPTNEYVDISYLAYVVSITFLVVYTEFYDFPLYKKFVKYWSENYISDLDRDSNAYLPPNEAIDPEEGVTGQLNHQHDSKTSFVSIIDNWVFGWDTRNQTKQTFVDLFSAFRAYLVGCAWYSWSILSFQNYFSFLESGSILGLVVFALFVTYAVLWMFSRWTLVPDYVANENNSSSINDISDSKHNEFSEKTMRKKQITSNLLLLAGRLVVGWAWQQSITSAVGLSIPTKFQSRLWLAASVRFIIAAAVIILGAYVDFGWPNSFSKKSNRIEKSDDSDSVTVCNLTHDKKSLDISDNHVHSSDQPTPSYVLKQDHLRVPLLDNSE